MFAELSVFIQKPTLYKVFGDLHSPMKGLVQASKDATRPSHLVLCNTHTYCGRTLLPDSQLKVYTHEDVASDFNCTRYTSPLAFEKCIFLSSECGCLSLISKWQIIHKLFDMHPLIA